MNLFAKARAGVNLSPAQRATLKLIEGFAIAGIVAALPVLAEALTSNGTIIWNDVLHAALAAFATATGAAILKYAKAHADTPLPTNTPAEVPNGVEATSDSTAA